MRIGNRLGGRGRRGDARRDVRGHDGGGGRRRSESSQSPWADTLANQSGDQHFGVYVPTRFGGELTVKTTDGKVVNAWSAPTARSVSNGQEVGVNQQGWYTFKVAGAGASLTRSRRRSSRSAQSTRKPWNFYYWPTKADAIHEPWAGGNGRVDTMQAYGDDIMVGHSRRLHRSRSGHRPRRSQRPARNAGRRPATTRPGSPTSTTT